MKLIICLIYLLSTTCVCQETDYRKYHICINKAEELFFLESKVDSSLFYYDKVICDYDFIFVKDIVNVAQIAIFSKKPYLKYIEKGFEQGLKLSHLEKYKLFDKALPNLKKNNSLKITYTNSRKNYLSKIDFKYLDCIYKLAIKDQNDKYNYDKNQINVNYLFDLAVKKGFPSDKTIGISDSTIFKEIKKPWLDLYQQRKSNKKLFYFTSDEQSLSNSFVFTILYHYKCSFHNFKEIYLKEITKGNIHPREVAFLYDLTYDFIDDLPHFCDNVKMKGIYNIWDANTNQIKYENKKLTNEMRKKLFIVSLETDKKKREYEKKYGFKLFSGFYYCR